MFFAGSFDETKMEDVCSAKYQQVVFLFNFFFFGLGDLGRVSKISKKKKKIEGWW